MENDRNGRVLKKLVTILMGGISGEHYLSRRSGENIFLNIDRSKYDVRNLIWMQDGSFELGKLNSLNGTACRYRDLKEAFFSLKTDVLFNALHGDAEGDGKLNGLLELLRIPYTGNRFYTCFAGMNKFISKLLFQHLDLLTPEFITVNKDSLDDISGFTFPCVIKPSGSGSSLGVRPCPDLPSARSWIKTLFERGFHDILVEEYIHGREYSVGILGRYDQPDSEKIVFPVGCISYDGAAFDEQCKFNNKYHTVIPSGLPVDQEKKLKDISLLVHHFFAFEGISRTDFLVAGKDAYLLEVNTHPGLAPHSIITAMIGRSTMTLSRVIDFLIQFAV